MRKHLDLGCGKNPRNPYGYEEIYGIDISEESSLGSLFYIQRNLSVSEIPFDSGYFDSVSAFDFLEHIPRVLVINGMTILPFVKLMNEIYRVLKPGGKFYALTPAYPKESAFVDPTHVNIITADTHKYFTQPDNWAVMYGFCGNFQRIRTGWCNFEIETKIYPYLKKIAKKIYTCVRKKTQQHFLWEFGAIKREE
jgi:SAM-dependent methyltransferase